MVEFTKPYWYRPRDLDGLDFNRSIAKPGEKEGFPDGAVGIYVDDNFSCVAALPLDPYLDKKIEDIVAELWPTYVEQATYTPDDDTPERLLWHYKREAEYERAARKEIERNFMSLRHETDRLRQGRTDIVFRSFSKLQLRNNYFIRQYEHLLIAMAHHSVPRKDLPGICSVCNLLNTDRVHQKEWIDRHDAGYRSDVLWHGEVEEDQSDSQEG